VYDDVDIDFVSTTVPSILCHSLTILTKTHVTLCHIKVMNWHLYSFIYSFIFI